MSQMKQLELLRRIKDTNKDIIYPILMTDRYGIDRKLTALATVLNCDRIILASSVATNRQTGFGYSHRRTVCQMLHVLSRVKDMDLSDAGIKKMAMLYFDELATYVTDKVTPIIENAEFWDMAVEHALGSAGFKPMWEC
jgi:hypothetical protein